MPAIFRQLSRTSVCCTMLFICLLLVAGNSAAATATSYSIVLSSAPGKNLKWELQESHLFKGHTVYVEQTTIKGAPWERLNVGFFKQRKQADSLKNKIQKTYPGAWLQKASAKNIAYTINSPASFTKPVSAAAITASIPKQALLSGSASLTEKQLDSLMQRAKTDFKNKKYSSSIRYLNALLAAGEHKYSHEALELLGLARQRKGQTAHAVETYKKYLALYPDSDGSDRVRQRLNGLLTAASTPRKNIPMSTTEERGNVTTYGSLAQYYQNNTTSVDDIGTTTTLSQLVTFFDLTTLLKTTAFDHRFQFTSDHVYDFIDSSDDSEFRFIEAYYELSYRKTGTSGRFGRQKLRTGGILNRFDGLSVGYQFTPDMRVNFLGGFPVDIDNKTSINEHKTFYGFTFETGTFLQHWSMNLFYFDQENDGLKESNPLGADVRYRDKKVLLFGMVDYDLLYDELTILQLNTNILLDQNWTVYMNVLKRKSPLLATSNALIGRQEQSLEELKEVLNIEQIYQLARDRTADSETVTFGGSKQLNEKYQATADITFIHRGDTVASGGVAATPDTGTDYYINTQLIANSLLMKHDSNVFGVRFYDTDASNTISFITNSRFPVARKWRMNPRLQYDIREFSNGRSQQKLRALLRTDYRFIKKVLFEFDIGYDETFETSNGQDLGNNSLHFTLGYRWDF
jgi:tetratricopeptide (TPR) repeat protein